MSLTMTIGIDISKFIVSSPDICNNLPRLSGTRITVQSLVIDYQAGMSPEDIAIEYPQLNLAQIYSALAYYHANKQQIEADIDLYKEECNYWEAEHQAGKI
jgi:uncharacterized protein (DUF433 family)